MKKERKKRGGGGRGGRWEKIQAGLRSVWFWALQSEEEEVKLDYLKARKIGGKSKVL